MVFHEITKGAVQDAVANPRELGTDLINAQQARRALDYLVGFNLSPLLWRKIKAGLSAGRVQSPALRMICEREDEIEAFVPKEYWSIVAELEKDSQPFGARPLPPRRRQGQAVHGDERRSRERGAGHAARPCRGDGPLGRCGRWPGARRDRRREEAAQAQRDGAVHDVDAAAGGLPGKLGFGAQRTNAHGAGTVRGGSTSATARRV